MRYYNRKHSRLGTVWCGRYKAKLIPDQAYWLQCLRYIEHNPVEAGLVTEAAAYRWSSFRVHAHGAFNQWLADHPVFDALGSSAAERQMKYRQFCDARLKADECQTPWLDSHGV